VTTTYTYGELERPTAIVHARGGATLQEHRFNYDAGGRVVRHATGDRAVEYDYDALGRLRTARRLRGAAVEETLTRAYDAAGNLTSRVDAAGTTTFRYDASDRLLEASGPGGVTTYEYTGRGALAAERSPREVTRFTYDDLDHLTGVVMPDGREVRYAYDGAGRLRARTEGGVMRVCVHLPDNFEGRSDCAVTYTAGGAEDVEATSFGPAGPFAQRRGGGARYLLDGLQHSVTGETGAAGALDAAWSYDAFGARTTEAGAAGSYGFDGERHDPVTGLVYLRARWYQPSTGRFLTPDAFGAAGRDPRSLHRYVFAYNAPLDHTDPSGEFGLGSVSISFNVQSILASIRTVAYYCLRHAAVGGVYRGFAHWAMNMVVRDFAQAIPGLAGLAAAPVNEFAFMQELVKFLCHGGGGAGPLLPYSFFYRVDSCGNPITRPSGSPGFATCFNQLMNGSTSGIDIVFQDQVPIELKMGSRAMDRGQLQTFCRFGAAYGIHAVVYAYWKLPSDAANLRYARSCYQCWEGGACGRGRYGSIYVAFGVDRARGASDNVYVPAPRSLCH
jgi:RHS repeat-associated protein